MGDTPLLERVKALAPLVEASADEMERRAALTDEVAAAIRESGALHLMVPAEMGGDELGIVDDIEVFEELARQDGSVGWSTMAASVSTTFAAIYTSDDVAEGLFGTDREAVLAGQLAPMGRAEVDGDGYVVSGSYRFGSGSDQTTHMLAGCLVFRDGEMVMRPNGMPDVVAAVIPNDQVEFKGNWDVMGLSGTASVDYEVAPIRVSGGEVFSIFTEVPERGSDVHRLGVTVITAAGHAGWALGVARRALDELASIAATKARMSQDPLAQQQVFQVGYAEAEAKVRAARAVRDGVVRRRRGGGPRRRPPLAEGEPPGPPVGHLGHRGLRRGGRVGLPRGRHRGVAQPERARSLPPRHERGDPARHGRAQDPHRRRPRPPAPTLTAPPLAQFVTLLVTY